MLTAIPPKGRKITKVEQTKGTIVFYSEHEKIRVQVKTPQIVRVTATPAEAFSDHEKPGVVFRDTREDYTLTEEAEEYVIATDAMNVKIWKATGAIAYYDADGELLLQEAKRAPRTFEAFETYTLAGGPQKTRTIETADGKKEVLEEPLRLPMGRSNHIRLDLELGDEALYGFGQHEQTMGSLRGKTVYIHQANRQIAVPVVVSTKGYGILVDAYSPMIFRDDVSGSHIYVEAAPELDYYIMTGGMNEVIRGYRTLTGKAVMLPKWAFGYVQSQERFETQEEILETARRSRELGIGTDCLVLDGFSWGDNMWGQKSYDESRFPNPTEMIKKLHRATRSVSRPVFCNTRSLT